MRNIRNGNSNVDAYFVVGGETLILVQLKVFDSETRRGKALYSPVLTEL